MQLGPVGAQELQAEQQSLQWPSKMPAFQARHEERVCVSM